MASVEGKVTFGETLSVHKYWKNTINVCEAALSMLSVYEQQGLYLIDTVTVPLRQLIGSGRDFDAMRIYQPPAPNAVPTKKLRKTTQLDFDPSSNWTIKDPSKVLVHLPDNTEITAQAITTVEQLEAIIPEIRTSKCVALDCEFLGRKNNLPELKVVQIAVSKTLGYAIIIDLIGHDTVRNKLKPVLEDPKLNRIGWAFRADAQAIEGAFHDVELGPTLDLQAKLKTVANEEMNLANAMKKYAKDWEGLEEFQKAKQLGDTFQFLDKECIWLQNPLPPTALVYSVFDVVSLVALWESTLQYETDPKFYWPTTIISTLSPKALDRWYRDRHRNSFNHQNNVITLVNSPRESSAATTNTTSPTKGKGRRLRPEPENVPSTENLSDEDFAYKTELDRAMQLSLEEYGRSKAGEVDSTGTKSLAYCNSSDNNSNSGNNNDRSNKSNNSNNRSKDSNSNNVNPWHQFRDANRPSPKVIHMDYNKPGEFEKGWATMSSGRSVDSGDRSIGSRSSRAESTEATPQHKLWSEESKERMQSQRGLNASASSWEMPATHADSPPPTSQSPSMTARNIQAPESAESWNANPAPSSSVSNSSTSSIPVSNTPAPPAPQSLQQLNANWYNDQTGSFKWQPDNWSDLVNSSMKQWQQGKDVEITDYEKNVVVQSPPPQQNTTSIQFKTSVMPDIYWKHEKDSWEKVEQRPNTMQIPLRGVAPKAKYRPRGPRAHNPDDSDMSSDEDNNYANDSSEDDKVSSSLYDDTCVDDIYLNDQRIVHMHAVTRQEQLGAIVAKTRDESQLEVAISFNFHPARKILKALQLYLNTGDSYTILIDQVCNADPKIIDTPLGYLLTSSSVRRIGWCFDFVARDIEAKVGFPLGQVVDLSLKLATVESEAEMPHMFRKYLPNWPNLSLYNEAKTAFDSLNSRNFSGSVWDKNQPPHAALRYSTMQGVILYQLYSDTLHLGIPEDNTCTWPDCNKL